MVLSELAAITVVAIYGARRSYRMVLRAERYALRQTRLRALLCRRYRQGGVGRGIGAAAAAAPPCNLPSCDCFPNWFVKRIFRYGTRAAHWCRRQRDSAYGHTGTIVSRARLDRWRSRGGDAGSGGDARGVASAAQWQRGGESERAAGLRDHDRSPGDSAPHSTRTRGEASRESDNDGGGAGGGGSSNDGRGERRRASAEDESGSDASARARQPDRTATLVDNDDGDRARRAAPQAKERRADHNASADDAARTAVERDEEPAQATAGGQAGDAWSTREKRDARERDT